MKDNETDKLQAVFEEFAKQSNRYNQLGIYLHATSGFLNVRRQKGVTHETIGTVRANGDVFTCDITSGEFYETKICTIDSISEEPPGNIVSSALSWQVSECVKRILIYQIDWWV